MSPERALAGVALLERFIDNRQLAFEAQERSDLHEGYKMFRQLQAEQAKRDLVAFFQGMKSQKEKEKE